MIEILKYLFETYMKHSDQNVTIDRDSLIIELRQKGFNSEDINKSFAWLAGLLTQQQNNKKQAAHAAPIRIFTDEECRHLDASCRGLLMHLEQTSNLDPKTREIIISQLMRIDKTKIKTEHVRLVISMINLLNMEHPRLNDE